MVEVEEEEETEKIADEEEFFNECTGVDGATPGPLPPNGVG